MTFLKSRAAIIMLLLAAASVVGVVSSHAAHAGRPTSPPGLSNLPAPVQAAVPLAAGDIATFADAQRASVALSPTSVDRLRIGAAVSLYRVNNSSGPPCFATGPRIATGHVIGMLACAPNFPSADRLVLDFTVFHGTPGQSDARVWESSGIAADNVSRVAFETADGTIAASAAVTNNLFEFTTLPQGLVAKLVAFDAAGDIVWSRSV
jgi:hypothetical protein